MASTDSPNNRFDHGPNAAGCGRISNQRDLLRLPTGMGADGVVNGSTLRLGLGAVGVSRSNNGPNVVGTPTASPTPDLVPGIQTAIWINTLVPTGNVSGNVVLSNGNGYFSATASGSNAGVNAWNTITQTVILNPYPPYYATINVTYSGTIYDTGSVSTHSSMGVAAEVRPTTNFVLHETNGSHGGTLSVTGLIKKGSTVLTVYTSAQAGETSTPTGLFYTAIQGTITVRPLTPPY